MQQVCAVYIINPPLIHAYEILVPQAGHINAYACTYSCMDDELTNSNFTILIAIATLINLAIASLIRPTSTAHLVYVAPATLPRPHSP